MEKTTKKKLLSLILCMMLIVAMAFCTTACGGKKTDEIPSEALNNANVMGEGATEFIFAVTDTDGEVTTYEIHTDKKTVGEALLELEIIDGEVGDYGLYVKTVNGVTLDYDKDGKYWAFYVNGEYAQTGVDSTDVEEGATYSFKAE